MKIRAPQVAGYFYPSGKHELKKLIEKFLVSAKKIGSNEVHSILCPHAGYEYCGEVAGWSYKQIENLQFKRVFILANNHSYVNYSGASVPKFDFYETPLGRVKISSLTNELLKNELFLSLEEVHLTHVVEVQLPFLQVLLEEFEIVPIVLSMLTDEEQKEIAKIIEEYLDEKTLIVISSDLSHYYPYEKAVKLDRECLRAIEEQNIELVKMQQACSLDAILVVLRISKSLGWKCKVLQYKNSGDTSGSRTEVVGYGSAVFYS